ncbi:MAG: uroporphyrinogen-III C-methyltransferase, partial [Actinobacteria bacterium]|nr:uroporphyrinogen-III C-methyltransferase [Actinomycetota bacterium]
MGHGGQRPRARAGPHSRRRPEHRRSRLGAGHRASACGPNRRRRGGGEVTVHLVGAGPGDPELLTVRAARLVAAADVIVHDRLADASILSLAKPGAEFIDVGKRPGAPTPQENINALLVHLGSQGIEVVRLKGGDPFVFGRGGEEAEALRAAEVPYTIVPGITSSVAVPAAAGIPVTHRGVSVGFTVVTGHRESGGAEEVAWEALAKTGTTIVVLMGVAYRASIAARLIA